MYVCRPRLGSLALVCVDFLDELDAGLAPVSAPEVRAEFQLAYTGLATLLLVAPFALALVLETPLLVRSDRWRRDRAIPIGLGAMGLFLLMASRVESGWGLALALGAWGSASGLTCALSQGALMNAFPDQRERWMTRWTLMGVLGDVVAPLLVWGAMTWGWGWRGALVAAAALHGLHAAMVVAVGVPDWQVTETDVSGEEPGLGVGAALREAVTQRGLLLWLGLGALCSLLDETLVAFGSLHLRDGLGASRGQLTVAFTLEAAAAAVALLATDRVLARVDPIRLLRVCGIGGAVAFGLWLVVPWYGLSVLLLALTGFFAAPMYPVAAARAYATCPGRPGLVNAVEQVGLPFVVGTPLLLGVVADVWGITFALAWLLLQPLGAVVVSLFVGCDRSVPRGEAAMPDP